MLSQMSNANVSSFCCWSVGKDALSAFNDKIKQSYDATMLEVEKHKKVLSEKATGQYVEDLASKVVMKLTGVRS